MHAHHVVFRVRVGELIKNRQLLPAGLAPPGPDIDHARLGVLRLTISRSITIFCPQTGKFHASSTLSGTAGPHPLGYLGRIRGDIVNRIRLRFLRSKNHTWPLVFRTTEHDRNGEDNQDGQ
ncbi:hypothetical protein A605_00190 [Corynebacterium halotolerans YIM 70093 = DSM 44683]|uniref:Uncharacterized protein n=1 Tax=Corynebacterium halotolerans YIM 70093 = DSM 44683 TaxID=1121362 RepID=M1P303_9CORY|nr:hypothetical protein A605_00190 [Corynebacterium halotolerans YIM 70093 = DSM 44683]